MIKRVLVGIGDQRYTVSATKHAIDVACHSNAKLTAMSVLDSTKIQSKRAAPISLGAAGSARRNEILHETEEVVRESSDVFVQVCESLNFECDVVNCSGDPLQEFIDHSRYYDFFVFGLHGLFDHGVLDDPPDILVKLISSGVYPILAVPDFYKPIERVVIAYSGSMESSRTLRSFVQHKHLWPLTDIRIVKFGKDSSQGYADLIQARNYLSDHGCECSIHFVEDSSFDVSEFAAKWNADLIVMGNSAKNLLRRRIFGETALKTIRQARIPLFLAQ
ncbi:MAG: universal stress protein [Planctomycetales bacterium]|nr:universal stress protein [Planctomycetales bacterium]